MLSFLSFPVFCKIINGMSDGSMKDNTDRIHSLPVIFFHSLLDPVQHDPHKTIFIKICDKPLFFFRHRLFLRLFFGGAEAAADRL